MCTPAEEPHPELRSRGRLRTSETISAIGALRACLAAFPLLIATFALGHAQTAQILGTVTDLRGAPIAGAAVRVVDQATGIERKCTTGDDGFYRIPFMLPATYQIFVQAAGFATASSPSIPLDVGQVLSYDVLLKVGAITQTVLVDEAQPLLQTGDASVGQVISTEMINKTPLNGRNWVYIAQLAAGVDPTEGTRGAGKGDFNADGQRAEQNNFILDGVDDNTTSVDFLNGASFVVRPPPDALAEFRIQTADYSAAFGRSAGAVVNASLKSGSNERHGALWEYARNDAFDARDWEDTSIPKYRENQFGGMLGFPILRNRLFFFADAEANQIVFEETNVLTVPTALMRQGNFAELLNGTFNGTGAPLVLNDPGNPGALMGSSCGNPENILCASSIDPVAQNLLSLYPAPNAAGPSFVNNYVANRNSVDNTSQLDVRADWNASSRDRAFARFSLLSEPGLRPAPLGNELDGGNFLAFGDDGSIRDLGRNLAVNATHVFSDRLANDLHLGFNGGHFAFTQENAANLWLAPSLGLGGVPAGTQNGGLPTVNIGGISGFGSPEYYAANERQNVFEVVDDVERAIGSQSLSFGVDFQRIRFSTEEPAVPRGEYDYDSSVSLCPDSITFTGYGVADFLANSMGCAEVSNIAGTRDLRRDIEAYFEDDWRVAPRFTVNLGVRYQDPQPYRELSSQQAEWFLNGPLSAGNTPSVFRLPAESAGVDSNSSLWSLLAAAHATVQWSGDPALVEQQRTNFAPRLGIAVLLTPRLVLRSGFGIFYGGLENVGYSGNLGNNPPFVSQSSYLAQAPSGCAKNNCPTDGLTLDTGFASAISAGLQNALTTPSLRGIESNPKTPYGEEYTFALEYGIRRDLAAVLGYVGSESHHLVVFTNPNAPLSLQANGADPTTLQPLANFGSATFCDNIGHGSYNSLQATLERRSGGALNFLATYTYAHAMDDAPTPLGSNGDDGYPNTNIQPIQYQYSSSPFDVRQRMTLNATGRLPSLHQAKPGSTGAEGSRFLNIGMRSLLEEWSASLTFVAQTGNPFSVTPDYSAFHAASGASVVYAELLANPFRGGGAPPASNPGIVCPAELRNRTHWYNPCAFGNPVSGSLIAPGSAVGGNAALPYLGGKRNDVYGPGYQRVNLSLFKDFHLSGLRAFEFRADGFNLLNTPSYANPNNNSTGGGLQSGIATNSSAGGQLTSPRFFQNFTPDARFLQFSLKCTF